MMSISRDRIRLRRPPPPVNELEREVAAGIDQAFHWKRKIDGRFSDAIWIIHVFRPYPDGPPFPALIGQWPSYRPKLKGVADYFEKNRGRVPPRFQPAVSEIKILLGNLSEHPVIPGSPWEEIRAILTKAGFSA